MSRGAFHPARLPLFDEGRFVNHRFGEGWRAAASPIVQRQPRRPRGPDGRFQSAAAQAVWSSDVHLLMFSGPPAFSAVSHEKRRSAEIGDQSVRYTKDIHHVDLKRKFI
jgi:hypothetical protein